MSLFGDILGGVLGLGGAVIGNDGPDPINPYEVADAQWWVSNPDVYTPFSTTTSFKTDDGEYGISQQLTPQMQALFNAMTGMAGRSRETYQSSMPEGLNNRLSEYFGSDVNMPTYDRGSWGFGQDKRTRIGNGSLFAGYSPNDWNYDGTPREPADNPEDLPPGASGVSTGALEQIINVMSGGGGGGPTANGNNTRQH